MAELNTSRGSCANQHCNLFAHDVAGRLGIQFPSRRDDGHPPLSHEIYEALVARDDPRWVPIGSGVNASVLTSAINNANRGMLTIAITPAFSAETSPNGIARVGHIAIVIALSASLRKAKVQSFCSAKPFTPPVASLWSVCGSLSKPSE